MNNTAKSRICVIGGGAAGMMAAGTAEMFGGNVTLFEHQSRLGRKLGITGKGRCNVTNNTDVQGFLINVTKNHKFLYAALNAFSPLDTMQFFEDLNVPLVTERGRRVFPESQSAKDIVEAMKSFCSDAKIINEHVKGVKKNEDGTFTVTASKDYIFDKVILATGGKSYPATGSDGSGYRIAIKLGHTVTELIPSLVPLYSYSTLCKDMQGLSLKNVMMWIEDENGKEIYTGFGEMMFAHFGVTGPLVLSASAYIRDYDVSNLTMHIDLKPALISETLDKRLLTEFSYFPNKDLINVIDKLMPSKMVEPFIKTLGIDGRKKVNAITKEDRAKIVSLFKNFSLPLSSLGAIEEAIVTSGGIEVKEIDPRTMQSKLVNGLFLAGEIIDVDALTGGFNLQIAFSTGYLAGKFAAEL